MVLVSLAAELHALSRPMLAVGRTNLGVGDCVSSNGASSWPILPEADVISMVFGAAILRC